MIFKDIESTVIDEMDMDEFIPAYVVMKFDQALFEFWSEIPKQIILYNNGLVNINEVIRNIFEKTKNTEVEEEKAEPYIYDITLEISVKSKYNPSYGDSRICKCGHRYDRHFDFHEDFESSNCKYCECVEFEEED